MAICVVANWGGTVRGKVSGLFFFSSRELSGKNCPVGNCPHEDIVRGGTLREKLSRGEVTGHRICHVLLSSLKQGAIDGNCLR